MAPDEPTLELLLARNLIASVVTPAFLVDDARVVVFFNESAGQLMGRRFEESGRLTREEWNEIGPVDEQGRPLPDEEMPLGIALRHGRPARGRFRIKTDRGDLLEVEATALPLVGESAFHGALVMFVPVWLTAPPENN
jgi:PAS domain-containing protein